MRKKNKSYESEIGEDWVVKVARSKKLPYFLYQGLCLDRIVICFDAPLTFDSSVGISVIFGEGFISAHEVKLEKVRKTIRTDEKYYYDFN